MVTSHTTSRGTEIVPTDLTTCSADALSQLAGDLRRAGAPEAPESDRVAALLAMAELLEAWAQLAGVTAEDDVAFDDVTAQLVHRQVAVLRVLDATRPGSYVAGQLADCAVELRRAAAVA